MENTEEVLAALGQFTKEPATDIPQLLDDYLEYVSKSGYTQFPWVTIKPLFKVKLENVISEFIKLSPASSVPVMPNVEPFNLEEMKTRIWDQFESYDGIPFTIQRLCELLTTPTKNYKRIDKFLRGLEKVMLVVSTIEPKPLPAEMSNGVSLETSASGSSSTSQDLAAAGSRRLGDSLESPAKRMRLSIEEDGGPCDSADQLPTPVQESSPPGNECIPAAGPLAEPVIPSTSSSPQGEGSGESMEIDAECTSSQARLELSSGDKSADSAAKLADVAKAEETGSSEAAPEESKHGEDEDMKVDSAEEVKADSVELAAAVNDAPAASDSADSAAAAAVAAEETATADGDSAAQTGAASELECGAEEGISTSGEPGPATTNAQVETNSEAEASTAEQSEEASPADTAAAPEQAQEEQQSVGSSQSDSEKRAEETVGMADSSDEAEQPRSAPMDTAEAEPSPQQGEDSPDQSV